MSAINRAPTNTNLLQPTKFLLTVNRVRPVTYFCQSVNIPAITLGEVNRATPFLDMFSPGTKLSYDPLDVTFLINEDLSSWKSMYDWFLSIADPDGFEGRDHSPELQKNTKLSDITLTILNNLNNPILRVEFINCFPLNMSSIRLDTTQDADTILTCDVSFRYQSYKYLTI